MSIKSLTFQIGAPINTKFTSVVRVTTEGMFVTSIPAEVVQIFQEHGIELQQNRLGNPGYFEDVTYLGLTKQIASKIEILCSERLVSERRVLRYSISTSVSYQIKDDDVVPNGCYMEDGGRDGKGWRSGTETRDATHRGPYGLGVVVIPCTRKDYVYEATGTTRVEYHRAQSSFTPDAEDPWMWLASLTGMDSGSSSLLMVRLDDIEYTEEAGWFFVNLIKGLCRLNETIKPFLKPDTIQALIAASAGGAPLLGSGGGR